MAMPEMEAVKDAALKYDKPTLGRMAQLGQISATLAVMAGMMRDRIVQSEMKPPTKTVAQEILPADSMGMEGFSDPTAVQQPVMRRAGGLTQIPVRDNMYEMAGGGIVAFQAGGSLSERIRREFESLPIYKAETEGIPGAEMFSFVAREMRGDVRIDPETGKPVSFGEYLKLKDRRTAKAAQEKGLGAAATAIPSTAQTAVQQAAVEDPMRGQSDVGFIPPEVFAADQEDAQARNRAALQAAQEARTPAAAPTAAPIPTKVGPSDLQKAAEAKPFDISAEAQRVADARKQFLGEDPYTKYLTEQLEKSGKEGFTDRALEALQMIQVGNLIREGKSTGEEGIAKLGQARLAKKQAQEARVEKMAQLKGREYESKAKAFETAAAREQELAKEARFEKRDISKEDREAKRRLEEATQKQGFNKELIRLQKTLTPVDFNRELLDYAMGNKGTDDQQKFAKGVIESRYSVTSGANRGKLTEKQAYDIVAARPENFNKPIAELRRQAKLLQESSMEDTGGGMGAGNVDTNNPLLLGS